jgi:hypothetical protein
MMFGVVGYAYVGELSELPIQVLLLFVVVLYLVMVTFLKVPPVEWRNGVRGLFELISSLFVVAFVILVFYIFCRLSSVDLFVASFAGDRFRCFLA